MLSEALQKNIQFPFKVLERTKFHLYGVPNSIVGKKTEQLLPVGRGITIKGACIGELSGLIVMLCILTDFGLHK